MYPTSVRAGALACALLATTALASPALAQTAPPPRFHSVDGNGVDLVSGAYFFSLTEGTIGSGEGALSLQRIWAGPAGWTDNWSGRLYKRTSGGSTVVVVELGAISDTFTISGTTFTSTKGNGATLVYQFGSYVYTAADGTQVNYLAVVDEDPNFYQVDGPQCQFADSDTCAIPVSVVKPNGMTFSLNWDFVNKCVGGYDQNLNCVNPTAYFRFRGVSNSAGYSFAVNYLTDTPGNFSAPQTNWYKKTSVQFSNSASPPSSAPTVTYSHPSSTVTEVTDIGGRTWRLTNGSGGLLSGIRRPGATSDTTIINYSGGAVTSVAREGITTGYSRSVVGSTGTMTVTNALSQVSSVVSNLSIGRPTSVTDPLNRTTSFQYDTNARLTRQTAHEGNYIQYTYDARGNITETRRVAKSGTGLSDIVMQASYDSSCVTIVKCNKPNSTTDARGNTTDYTYDSTHGGILTVTQPTIGADRPQTRYSYSQVTAVTGQPVYLLTSISACQTGTSCVGSANEAKTSASYNTSNLLLVGVTSGNGNGSLTASLAMTYDALGNLSTMDGPLAGTADTMMFRYNSARQRIGTVTPDPDGGGALKHRATKTTITAEGLVTKVERGTVNSLSDTDWASFTPLEAVETTYDSNARPTIQKLTSGGTAYALMQVSYDALGRAECNANRMNPGAYSSLPTSACTLGTQGTFGPDRITKTVYNAAGQAMQQKIALGTSSEADAVASTFSNNGLIASVVDGEGNKTTYEYDGHDRLSKIRFPDATKGAGTSSTTDFEQMTYDAQGNITSRQLRGGATISFAFDALNRMTSKDLPTSEPDVNYTYDNLGRMTGASQTGHSLSFTYDALGRKLTQTGPQGTITSTFDSAGRRTRITHPDGFWVDHDYLVTGEMTAIRANGATQGVGVLASFAYDNLGRRTGLTRGNGTSAAYGFDAVSRLASLADNPVGTTHDQTLGFSHNPAGQIVENTRSNDLFAWSGHGSGSTNSAANGRNQITTVGSVTPTYDARGNMTSDGAKTFSYSSQNLLTGASGGIGLSYDPLMRLQELAGGPTARFAYDGADMIAEYDATNTLQKRFIFGPGADEPLAWYQASDTSNPQFLHADERGSVVAVSNGSGAVTAVNTYDEYGVPGSSNTGSFQFTGQRWLSGLGIYYYKARMYHPRLGRFLQTDPIGYSAGMNLFAYVSGDPVNHADPSGLDEREEGHINCTDNCTITVTGEKHKNATPEIDKVLDMVRKQERDAATEGLGGVEKKFEYTCTNGSKMTLTPDGKGSYNVHLDAKIQFAGADADVSASKGYYLGAMRGLWNPKGLNRFSLTTTITEGPGNLIANIMPDPGARAYTEFLGGRNMYLPTLLGATAGAIEVYSHGSGHEFGHTFGLEDRYDDPGEREAYHGTIMANGYYGLITDLTVEELIESCTQPQSQ